MAYTFDDTMAMLYNAGQTALYKAIEGATYNGRFGGGKYYIYSRCDNYELADNSNIRALSYLDLIEIDENGAYIPNHIIDDYIKAKEDDRAGFWPELDEVEWQFRNITEALDNIEENGFVDEDDYLQEENNARDAEALQISTNTGIDYERCLEFIYECSWIENCDIVQYYREDLEKFIKKVRKGA